MANSPQRDQIFISYSHKDQRLLSQLQTSLKPLVRDKKISVWDDTKIKAGEDWREQISSAIASAKVAVLLVSPDFLASDFIADHELPPLLEAAQSEGLRILWIAARFSMYEETEITRYQAVNNPAKPLASISGANREKELVRICKIIKSAVSDTTALNEHADTHTAQGAEASAASNNPPVPESSEVGASRLAAQNVDSPRLRFQNDLWPDPVSIKVVIRALSSGAEGVRIDWPASTQTLIETTSSLAEDLQEYHLPESDFHNLPPDWVALAYQMAYGFSQYANLLQHNVPRRIPLLWKGMKGYFSLPSCEKSLSTFVALANATIQLKLALFVHSNFRQKQSVVPSHLKDWLNINWAHPRNVLQCLFNIAEPVYAAEILKISNASFNHYVYGPRSKVLQAYFDFKLMNRPIINGWFADQLIPQIELIISEGWGDLNCVVDYCEVALINKVRDENNEQVDNDPRPRSERGRT